MVGRDVGGWRMDEMGSSLDPSGGSMAPPGQRHLAIGGPHNAE